MYSPGGYCLGLRADSASFHSTGPTLPPVLPVIRVQCMIRRLLAALLLLIVGIGAVACGGEEARGEANIQVIEPRLVRTPSGRRAFSGTLVNAGRQPLSIAQVDVALYDDSGSPVETVRIEVKDVAARDSVDFSGTIDSDKSFHQAQVKSILTP